MIIIAKANNASYVTISESPVRMKSHRHQLLSSEFERSKEKLFLSPKRERSNRHRCGIPPGLPLTGDSVFYFMKNVGICQEKESEPRGTRATDGRPYGAEFFGNRVFVLKTKGKGCAPVLVMRAGL